MPKPRFAGGSAATSSPADPDARRRRRSRSRRGCAAASSCRFPTGRASASISRSAPSSESRGARAGRRTACRCAGLEGRGHGEPRVDGSAKAAAQPHRPGRARCDPRSPSTPARAARPAPSRPSAGDHVAEDLAAPTAAVRRAAGRCAPASGSASRPPAPAPRGCRPSR